MFVPHVRYLKDLFRIRLAQLPCTAEMQVLDIRDKEGSKSEDRLTQSLRALLAALSASN